MFIEATNQKPEAASFGEPTWENIASYHCPFCSEPIEEREAIDMFFCTRCDFKISSERYEEILSSLEERF